MNERQAIEQRAQAAEQRVQELERKLEEEGRESSDLELLRQRLADEMEDERKQHQQDIAERDFAADQTRKKYQGTLCPSNFPVKRANCVDCRRTCTAERG